MLSMEWVDVKLQTELADAARRLARERDVTVSQLLRDLVTREIEMTRKIKSAQLSEEHLIEGLKSRLLPDFLNATTWPDLKARLRQRGFCLVASGGGLALHDRDSGRRICKASQLGFGYSKLMKKIGTPFPGHPHAWLAKRALPGDHVPEAPTKKSPEKDFTDDFDVIEPF
ncbi:MAG: hypothetical protein AAFY35_02105 [Pseudomonadota bacterium]